MNSWIYKNLNSLRGIFLVIKYSEISWTNYILVAKQTYRENEIIENKNPFHKLMFKLDLIKIDIY